MIKEIIIASTNEGKVNEIREKLKRFNFNILSLKDLPDVPEIIENGETFYDNALIKANAIYKKYGKPVIADDTGLVIEALNGEPGVRSARYAGENSTAKELREKVLKKMKNISKENRKAYFECVIIFKYGDREEDLIVSTGRLYGEIIDEERGDKGFGYDPIFWVEEINKTLAEITIEEKNKISHRGKAIDNLLKKLKEMKLANFSE